MTLEGSLVPVDLQVGLQIESLAKSSRAQLTPERLLRGVGSPPVRAQVGGQREPGGALVTLEGFFSRVHHGVLAQIGRTAEHFQTVPARVRGVVFRHVSFRL